MCKPDGRKLLWSIVVFLVLEALAICLPWAAMKFKEHQHGQKERATPVEIDTYEAR